MSGWTALVPIKEPEARKTRLASTMDAGERHRISRAMFDHVLAVLAQADEIAEVVVLAATRPEGWPGRWIADDGRGLNPELEQAARRIAGPLLVVHADLPRLNLADVTALTTAARDGVAVAPDHLGNGTNALAALDSRELAFHFGPDSFARHCAHYGARAVPVNRPGLAHDIDHPADLAAIRAR